MTTMFDGRGGPSAWAVAGASRRARVSRIRGEFMGSLTSPGGVDGADDVGVVDEGQVTAEVVAVAAEALLGVVAAMLRRRRRVDAIAGDQGRDVVALVGVELRQ